MMIYRSQNYHPAYAWGADYEGGFVGLLHDFNEDGSHECWYWDAWVWIEKGTAKEDAERIESGEEQTKEEAVAAAEKFVGYKLAFTGDRPLEEADNFAGFEEEEGTYEMYLKWAEAVAKARAEPSQATVEALLEEYEKG